MMRILCVAAILSCLSTSLAIAGGLPPSADGWMYWAERDTHLIHRTHLDGTDDEILFSSLDGVSSPKGIALDVAGDRVYWTMGTGTDKVQRGKLDGTGPVETLLEMRAFLGDIVLDLAESKMYFAQATAPTGKIWVANLDGTDVQEFLALDTPSAMAFDPASRQLYWGLSPSLACTGQAMIQRLDIDRGGIAESILTDLQVIRAIAVDSRLDWIYWSESCGGGIHRAHLDGLGAELLMPSETSRGMALDSASEMLYWTTTTGTDRVRRADLALKSVEDLLTVGLLFPHGIALIPGPPPEPADLNDDGIVNGFDLAILLGAWGKCPRVGSCDPDLDGSGIVNGIDLAMLLAAWS